MENAISKQRFNAFGVVCLKCGYVTISNQHYVIKSKRIVSRSRSKLSAASIEEFKRKLESHWVK